MPHKRKNIPSSNANVLFKVIVSEALGRNANYLELSTYHGKSSIEEIRAGRHYQIKQEVLLLLFQKMFNGFKNLVDAQGNPCSSNFYLHHGKQYLNVEYHESRARQTIRLRFLKGKSLDSVFLSIFWDITINLNGCYMKNYGFSKTGENCCCIFQRDSRHFYDFLNEQTLLGVEYIALPDSFIFRLYQRTQYSVAIIDVMQGGVSQVEKTHRTLMDPSGLEILSKVRTSSFISDNDLPICMIRPEKYREEAMKRRANGEKGANLYVAVGQMGYVPPEAILKFIEKNTGIILPRPEMIKPKKREAKTRNYFEQGPPKYLFGYKKKK